MESVTNCQPSGREWNGKPIYSIHLSDGRGGESFSQIAVGTSVNDLEITQTQYGLRIKKKQSQNNFQGGGKRFGNESVALSYSKDLVVGGKVELKDILSTADKLFNWLESKKDVKPPQPAVQHSRQNGPAPVQQSQTGPANYGGSSSDLPF